MDPITALRPALTAFLQAQQLRTPNAGGGAAWFAAQAKVQPELFDPEVATSIETAAAQVQGSTRAVLSTLAAHLRLWQRTRAGAGAEQDAATRNGLPDLHLPEARMSLDRALERLPLAESREERAALERASERFLRERPQPELRQLEAWLSVPAGPALATDWQEGARRFLDQTRDAFEDVLLFVLRRTGVLPGAVRLTDASWHDLVFLRSRPLREAPFFVPEGAQLVAAVQSWMEVWRWPPLKPELIGVPGSGATGISGIVAVPGQPRRLRLLVAAGWAPNSALVDAVADFERTLHVQEDDPPEARDLVHPAVQEATRALFRRQREEPVWLRRVAQLPREVTRDSARVAAALELLALREAVGRALYEAALFQSGPTETSADLFVETLRRAVGVAPPRGFQLSGLSPLPRATQFQGAVLAAEWAQRLREQFDEDYFRNPAAGTALSRRWARGAREDGESLHRALWPVSVQDTSGKPWTPDPALLTASFLERLSA